VNRPGRCPASAACRAVVALGVRHLVDKPVFPIVTLAYGVVHVVGKEPGIFQIEPQCQWSLPIRNSDAEAVRHSDLPELPAITAPASTPVCPGQPARPGPQSRSLSGISPSTPSAIACSSYVPGRTFGIVKWPSRRTVYPKLIVFRIVLPGHCRLRESAFRGCFLRRGRLIRIRQPDHQVRQRSTRRLRVLEHDLALHFLRVAPPADNPRL